MKQKLNFLQVTKRLAWLALAAAFLVICAAAISSVEVEKIKAVVYSLDHLSDGNDLITLDEIKEKILATYDIDLVGVDIERIDLADIEQILQEEAFIVAADAYIDAQGKLHLDISQRTPILRVMDLSGNNYYLDCDGVKLPLSKHFTARVPIASGAVSPFTSPVDSSEGSLQDVFHIVKTARKDDLVNAWLEGVHVTNHQEIHLHGNLGKFDVIFGDASNTREKFEKMKRFFEAGLPATGWNDIESINLKFANQVVTTSRAKT